MRGSVGRALVPVLGVLVLVGVVAVASTGSTPSGTTDSRPPADTLLDTFFSLALLALIPGAALLVYGLMQRKAIAREIASGNYRRMSLLGWLVLVTIGVAAFYVARPHFKNLGVGANDVVDLGSTTEGGAPENDPANGSVYEPEFAWVPVLLVVVLAAAGIAAYLLASRRRERVGLPERVAAEHVAERLGDDFDDHPSAIGRVGDAPDVAGLLEAVDDPGDGTRREPGDLRQLPGGRRPHVEELLERLDVGLRQSEADGHRLAEERSLDVHPPQRPEDGIDVLAIHG